MGSIDELQICTHGRGEEFLKRDVYVKDFGFVTIKFQVIGSGPALDIIYTPFNFRNK